MPRPERPFDARLMYLKWALCAATLSAIAVTPKLWTADRPYPTVPAIPGLPSLPAPATLALSALLVLSLVVVALRPRPSLLVLAPPVLTAALVLWDINRLQPCIYQYMLAFVALSAGVRSSGEERAKAAAGFGIIAIYFWSGLQKLNATFVHEVFPFLIHPLGPWLSQRLTPFWFVSPLGELSVGLLLFFPKTRKWGLAGAVLMHGFVLAVLGPFGQNYNSIVWPWNFWTVVMAFILFWKNDTPVLRPAWSSPQGKAILLLAGVLPALNYAGLWDGFLSMSYYSGRLRDAWIYLTPEGEQKLTAAINVDERALVRRSPNLYTLDVTTWGLDALNAPPYAEPRVYIELARQLELDGVPPDQMTLLVRDLSPLTVYRQNYSQLR